MAKGGQARPPAWEQAHASSGRLSTLSAVCLRLHRSAALSLGVLSGACVSLLWREGDLPSWPWAGGQHVARPSICPSPYPSHGGARSPTSWLGLGRGHQGPDLECPQPWSVRVPPACPFSPFHQSVWGGGLEAPLSSQAASGLGGGVDGICTGSSPSPRQFPGCQDPRRRLLQQTSSALRGGQDRHGPGARGQEAGGRHREPEQERHLRC